MYVTNLRITDLRSFRGDQTISLQRDDDPYAGWTVFAGRNGAGKSTLLKAIALAIIGPLAARSLAGVFTDWVRTGAPCARIATRLKLDTRTDRFQGSGRLPTDAFWTGLEWRTNLDSPNVLDRSKDYTGDNSGADRGPWADSPQGWFVAGYGPYRRLGPTTAEVVRLSADPVLARLVNLFNEAATLSEAVDWLRHVHMRALEKRQGAAELRDAVLEFMADGLLPDDSVVERVDSEGLWIRRNGLSLPIEQVSDGYRTVTAMVVDLLRRLDATFGSLDLQHTPEGTPICPHSGIVLIDEVDAHMHVEWQQRIGFWLTSRFPNLQFLVTTHSPFICQAASRRGIIRLPAPGEDRKIEHVDERLFNAIVNGSADDAVMSELFGLEHAHSNKAEGLRRDVAMLEGRVLRGQASTEEIEQYERLRAQLPDGLGDLADRRLRSLGGS